MERKKPDTNLKNRLTVVQFLIVAAVFVLGAKSINIQIFKAEELAAKAKIDYSKLVQITGERGEILDRNMNKLATSARTISITASPLHINKPEKTAKKLASILDVDSGKLAKVFATKKKFAWVVRRIPPAKAEQVRQLNLTGIYFEKDFKRVYPHRDIAAQVIGFTGSGQEGLEGLEFKLNSTLEGRIDHIRLKRSGKGGILAIKQGKLDTLKGQSVVLTIDKKIQYLSEQALEKAVKSNRAKSGIAVVMRPSTGELLSIAHYPGFNPNYFSGHSRDTLRNRSVTDPFEPGSVIKVFTAATALEKGFSPKSIFFCENGTYKVGRFTIHDTHDYDWLSINQIIKYSSNIGAVKIIETIGDQALYDYLTAFGFGKRTKIGCPGETPGLLIDADRWSRIDASSISFGQGMSVSSIQLISGISAIANKGRLMKPLLIKKILSNTGQTIQENHPEMIRQVISEKTAGQVKRMMNLVVQEEGTGIKAAMDGYSVCGKTGTAQKARKNGRGYSRNNYTAVFAGFAPYKNPQLAILVVVDEPRRTHYGGEVAAPAFKTIMAESFNYLNIPPETEKQMFAALVTGENQ